jgi:flagellar motor switch protein FliN/FliY
MPKDDNIDNSTKGGDEGLDDISWDDIGDDSKTSEKSAPAPVKDSSGAKKRPAEFSELKEGGVKSGSGDLDFIMDIPLEITVELGRTTMPIFDLLQLGQGSIVELTKIAGEPLEILVNKKLIARGEVVVVNEKFAIRLTDVVSTKERIENLK